MTRIEETGRARLTMGSRGLHGFDFVQKSGPLYWFLDDTPPGEESGTAPVMLDTQDNEIKFYGPGNRPTAKLEMTQAMTDRVERDVRENYDVKIWDRQKETFVSA